MSAAPPLLTNSSPDRAETSTAQFLHSVLTVNTVRLWGVKSAVSLLDQGITAGVGFGVNLLLARWLAPEHYGAFAVAFAILLFVSGFHNALLLEPMTVMGPSRHAERLVSYFRSQIVVHILFVGSLTAAALLAGLGLWRISPHSPLAAAVLGGGLALPFLLLLWLARRMCYVRQCPSIAAAGSALYLAIVFSGLFLLEHFARLSPFTAFALMGGGSFAAAGALLWLLRVMGRADEKKRGVPWQEVLHENWAYGRWLMGSTVLSTTVGQIQVLFVSALLGLGSAGVLRAMQLPALAVTQVSTAAGLLILPSFARDFALGATRKMRHKAFVVSLVLSAFTLSFAAITWVFASRVEQFLFAGKFASSAWLMPLLVLMTVAFGPLQGFGMALRAARKPQFDLISSVFAAPVALLSAYCCTKWWGLAGAAMSLVLGFAVQSLITAIYFCRRLPDTEAPVRRLVLSSVSE